MTTTYKLKILKIIKIVLLIIFVPILFFYLAIIVPEYLACINCVYEGEMGTDIWGNEVQCFGESKAFGEAFFQMFTLIISVFLAILLTVLFLTYRIRKSIK